MTKDQLLKRYYEIQKKYNIFYSIYGKWLEYVDKKTRELGLKNFEERNKLPTFHKGEGIKQGLVLLDWNLGRGCTPERVIEIMTDQANEPTCSEEYRAGVQIVLDDVLTKELQPFEPAIFMLPEGG